jgi:hypothetical protein
VYIFMFFAQSAGREIASSCPIAYYNSELTERISIKFGTGSLH